MSEFSKNQLSQSEDVNKVLNNVPLDMTTIQKIRGTVQKAPIENKVTGPDLNQKLITDSLISKDFAYYVETVITLQKIVE